VSRLSGQHATCSAYWVARRMSEDLKLCPWSLFSFLFHQFTTISSRAMDGHQMYSGGSVIGALNWYKDLAHPPLIFTRGQKVRNSASFSTSLNFEPHAFENAARYPNSETNFFCSHDHSMNSPSFVKLGPRIPENSSVKVPHPLKLHGENVLNCQ